MQSGDDNVIEGLTCGERSCNSDGRMASFPAWLMIYTYAEGVFADIVVFDRCFMLGSCRAFGCLRYDCARLVDVSASLCT